MRRSAPTPGSLDKELIALFADDPEGLAIVDAIAATQASPGRSLQRRRVALAAATLLVAVVVVGFLTVGTSKAGIVERALRVLDEKPAVRLTLVDERVAGQLVNLNSGAQRPLRHVIDEWYEQRRHVRRVRDVVGGVVVADTRLRVRAGADRNTVGSFIETYRRALERRDIEKVTPGFAGRTPVYWLTFPVGAAIARVAIARGTLRPTLIEYAGGDTRRFRVIAWKGLGRVPRATASPRPKIPGGHRQAKISRLAVTESLKVVGLPALRTASLHKTAGRGSMLKLVYSTRPVQGKLAGRYLRALVLTNPNAGGWTRVEASLPAGFLILIQGRPLQAFAHVGEDYLAIETSLGPKAAISTAQALLPAA
jgi:hypothetical protein